MRSAPRSLKRHLPALMMMLLCAGARAQTTAVVAGLNCPGNSFNVTGFNVSAASKTSSFSITKAFDACSAPLLQAALERQAFSSLLLTVSESDWTFPMAVLLQKVVFTNYSLTQSASDGSPAETIQVSAGSITSSGPFSLGTTTTIQIQGLCDFQGLSWNFNVQQTNAAATASKASFGDFAISKPVDGCSHALLTALSNKQLISSVTIVTTPTGAPAPLVQVTLKNVTVVQDQVQSEVSGDPVEQLSLTYQDITVENDTNHTSAQWNLVTNQPN